LQKKVKDDIEFTNALSSEYFSKLSGLAYIAASQPREGLADAIAEVLIVDAEKYLGSHDIEQAYRILLIASAAYIDRGKSLDWITNKLIAFSFAVQRGEPAATLYDNLQLTRKLTPMADWRLGKASKLAAAAMR